MQDRKTYAEGVTNVTADAKARIGMPVVDGVDTVASEATTASFAGEIPESGSMLVTLEVNGTVIAYREMYTFDPEEGNIQVGDYYIANDSGNVAIETMEGGDVVRLKVEPVEIEMNDVFRAAVGEVAPKNGGGSGGGGVLVVHMNNESGVLDKTWNEINSADVAVIVFSGSEDGETYNNREVVTQTLSSNGSYSVSTVYDNGSATYVSDSADGYPVHQ